MSLFRRILVALDLSKNDDVLIRHAAYLAENFGTERIYFLHAVENLEEKEAVMEKYDLDNEDEPLDEQVMKKLSEELSHQFPDDCELEAGVVEGSPYDALLHWSKVKNVDLMLLGRRKIDSKSGIVARKLARNAPCSVLFLPINAETGFNKLLVPIDLSEYSARVLEEGLSLRHQLEGLSMGSLFVFERRSLAFTLSRSAEQMDAITRKNAEEAADKFFDQFPNPALRKAFEIIEDHHDSPAQHIAEYAWENNYDLVMIGAQGHSKLEKFLLGSVAEQLVELDDDLPLLILKQ